MKSGRKPYGFYQDERAIVDIIKIKRRRRKGAAEDTPYRQIARELNAEKHRTQTGKLFCGQTVCNILNPAEPPERKKYPKKQHPDKYWSIEDVGKLFTACRTDKQKLIFELLIGAALRAGEAVALRIKDIEFIEGGALIEVREGKGCLERKVVVADGLAGFIFEYIKYYLAGTGAKETLLGLNYQQLYYQSVKVGRWAGLTKRTNPHSFRHTFATVLYNYEKDLRFVQEQLGHSSIDTTTIYTKCVDKRKLKTMKKYNAIIHQGFRAALFQSSPENKKKSRKERK